MLTLPPGISRPGEWRGAILTGSCLLSLLVAVLAFDRKLDTWGDNAEYIILARSIVQGRWMERINEPDSPPSRKFPFGFPLLLAGVEWLVPGDMLAMKALVLILYVMAMPLVYLLMRRYTESRDAAHSADSRRGIVVTLFSLLNPLLLTFSHQVMTEVPYLLVSVLALIAIEGASEGGRKQGGRALLIALTFSAIAVWIRVLGLALFAAAMLSYIVRREFRRGVSVGLGCLVALAVLQALGGGLVGSSYLAKVSQLNPDMPELGGVDLPGLAGSHRFLGNLERYGLGGYLSAVLLPLPAGHFFSLLGHTSLRLLSLAVIVVLAAGWWRQYSERPLVPLYCLFYLGFLLLAPARSASPRYLVPVIPFLLLFLMRGFEGLVRRVGGWLGRPRQSFILVTAFACLLALYLYDDYSVIAGSREYSPRWKSYFEAAEWLKEHTPQDSVIAGSSDHLLYLVSERRTIRFFKSTDPEQALAHLARYKADFVVVDDTFVTAQYVKPAIHAYPGRFEAVHATRAAPTTYILRVRKGQEAGVE